MYRRGNENISRAAVDTGGRWIVDFGEENQMEAVGPLSVRAYISLFYLAAAIFPAFEG